MPLGSSQPPADHISGVDETPRQTLLLWETKNLHLQDFRRLTNTRAVRGSLLGPFCFTRSEPLYRVTALPRIYF